MNNFSIALLVTSILTTIGMAFAVLKHIPAQEFGIIGFTLVSLCAGVFVKLRHNINAVYISLFTFLALGASYNVHRSLLVVGISGLSLLLIFSVVRTNYQIFKITGNSVQRFSKSSIWLLPTVLTIMSSWTSSGFGYRKLIYSALHLDAFFHASLTSMLQRYGVSTTGVDGLQPIHYHDLLHKCVATLANLSGFSPLGIFTYMHFMVVLPMLFCVFGKLAASFTDIKKDSLEAIGLTSILIMCFYRVFRISGFGDVFMHSETQGLALGLLFLYVVDTGKADTSKHSGIRFSLVSATMLLVLGLLKGPFAILGLIVAIARLCRLDWNIAFRVSVVFILTAVTALTLSKYLGGDSGASFGVFPYAVKSKLYQLVVKYLGSGPLPTLTGIIAHLVIFYLPCIAQLIIHRRTRKQLDLVLTFLLTFSVVFESVVDFDGPNVFWITCVPVLYSLCWISSVLIESKVKYLQSAVMAVFLMGTCYIPGIKRRLERYETKPSTEIVSLVKHLDTLKTERKSAFNGSALTSRWRLSADPRYFPLMYVALSEHPWTGLVTYPISNQVEGYGYGELNKNQSHKSVIQIGITIVDDSWSLR